MNKLINHIPVNMCESAIDSIKKKKVLGVTKLFISLPKPLRKNQ